MKTELAVITTVFMKDLVQKAVDGLSDEFDIAVYYYADFNEVLDIYHSIPPRIRGVVVSGPTPEHIILSAHPDDGRVVKAFMNDHAAIYKNFLRLFNEYPGLTTDRIFFDSLHLLGIDLKDYLYGDKMVSWEQSGNAYYEKMSTDSIIASEQQVFQMHLKLWRANRIDVSVTRFSSLMGPLREAGVNVRFLPPTVEYTQEVCREVDRLMQIVRLEENQPAVLLVTAHGCSDEKEHLSQGKMDQLGRHLQQYVKKFDAEAVITPAAYGYEVISSRQAVEGCTGDLQRCWMQGFLAKKLEFPVSVGYGLGRTLPQARLNAVDANREAVQHPGQSYLINDQDELVGPLQSGTPLVVSRKASPLVREVSSKTGLSSLTVQRVLSVMNRAEDGYITSQMLAQKLSVTQRSANRFLQALLVNGQAEVIGMRRATTKGRPERLYRLLIGEGRNSG